jgi:hypothetical protein
VKKHLHPHFPGLVVREALKLRIAEGGQRLGLIFLVHGHQGTLDSDRLFAFSRLPVRYLWRPIQRRLKIASTTPARDFKLRALHDDAMFRWALGRTDAKPVLIAGHTHRPVFSTPESAAERSPDAVADALRQLREHGGTPDQLAELRAELELVRTPPFGEPPKEMPVPCYFNTGCCSFGDGDVTGLELADTEIRLVPARSSSAARRAGSSTSGFLLPAQIASDRQTSTSVQPFPVTSGSDRSPPASGAKTCSSRRHRRSTVPGGSSASARDDTLDQDRAAFRTCVRPAFGRSLRLRRRITRPTTKAALITFSTAF